MNNLSEILLNYDIGNIEKISLIKAGVENENYIVRTNSETYILRIYNPSHSIRGSRTLEAVELELDFSSRARAAGINAPDVIKNINDKRISIVQVGNEDRFIALFTFLPGKSLKKYSKISTKELGKIVNTLFWVGKSFENIKATSDNNIISRGFKKFRETLETGIEIPKEILAIWNQVQNDESKIEQYELSVGLIHGDLKLENLFYDEQERLTAVLDFDDFRCSYLIEEAAMALMHNLHSTEENLLRSGNFEVFIGELKNDLLIKEIEHLRFFLRVRFLYDTAKYLSTGNRELVIALLADKEIKKHILD